MTPYSAFVRAHAQLTREEFLSRVEEPYLLLIDGAGEKEIGSGFRTVKFTKEAIEKGSDPLEPSLLPIRKRQGGNAFGMMITMGRASNNDIVIPNAKVSKFHAYFRQLGSQWSVSDANSRNGTFLNGAAVPKDKGSPIQPSDRIKLAKTLELVFYDPLSLYHKVQSDKEKHAGSA